MTLRKVGGYKSTSLARRALIVPFACSSRVPRYLAGTLPQMQNVPMFRTVHTISSSWQMRL